jgi:hypothetical protein
MKFLTFIFSLLLATPTFAEEVLFGQENQLSQIQVPPFLSLTQNGAVNTYWPITVFQPDTSIPTNTLTLTGRNGTVVTLGISSNVGGSWNSLVLAGFSQFNGVNQVQPGCGRMNQLAEFDRGYNQVYNPTEAGINADECTPTTITASTRKLVVNQFNLPLFNAAFTPTNRRSEQDLTLAYVDRSSQFGIPAIQIDTLIGYMRRADVLNQYIGSFDPNFLVQDWNLTQLGNQATTQTSLSRQQLIYGMRFIYPNYSYVMWKSSGVWTATALSGTVTDCLTGTDNTNYLFANGQTVAQTGKTNCGGIDNEFIILSPSNDPNVGPAICFREPISGPGSDKNLNQTYLSSSPTTPLNLHVQGFYRFDIADFPTNTLADLKFVHRYSGVDQPSLIYTNAIGSWQATFGRRWVLFGLTPNECYSAMTTWLDSGFTGDEPA